MNHPPDDVEDPGACPDEASLRGFLDSEVTGDSTGELARHLEACGGCRARMEGLIEIDPEISALLDRSRDPRPPAPALQALVQGVLARFDRRRAAARRSPEPRSRPAPASAGLRHDGPEQIGAYRIEGCAGAGAMGTVYQAVDTRLGRRVALKVLRTDGRRDPTFAERFRREAAMLASLNHPNIVSVYETAEWQGQPYLALEFIAGGTLARWTCGQAQPADVAARAVATLAEAVQYAHEQGVIHRDLKPGNILLQPLHPAPGPGAGPEVDSPATDGARAGLDGFRLMIADFGVARWRDELSDLTRTGEPVGTPAYMAPEQARGQGERVGPAADVYALGVILYELLAGHPPFRSADLANTLRMVQESEAPALRRLRPGLPRDLETIALKCLEKEPARRYATAAELAADLRRFLEHRSIVARPVRLPGRAYRWIQRNPQQAALILALTLSLAVGGLILSAVETTLRRQASANLQQADTNLREAVFALDHLVNGLSSLGEAVHPSILRLRNESRAQVISWCEQYLRRAPAPERWSESDLKVANLLIRFRSDLGQAAAVEPLARQACQAAEGLEGAGSGESSATSLRVTSNLLLGHILRQTGRLDEARAAFVRADAVIQDQLRGRPDDVQALGTHQSILAELIECLEAMGRPAEALDAARAGRAAVRAMRARQPEMPAYRLWDAQFARRLGSLLGQLGRWPEALVPLEEGLGELEPVPEGQRARASLDATRAGLIGTWAEAVLHLRPDRPLPASAQALLRRLPDAEPPLLVQVELAGELAAAGEPERALTLARSAAGEPLTVRQAPLALAAVLARLAADPAADPAERDRRADLALDVLQRARAEPSLAGPAERDRLRGPDFAPLRDRPEFQRLLDELDPTAAP